MFIIISSRNITTTLIHHRKPLTDSTSKFHYTLRHSSLNISRDCGGYGATFQTTVKMARFSRPRQRRHDFPDQGGDGPTFQTGRRGRNFSDQDGDGATLKTKGRGRDFPDHRGDGATKNQFLATKAETTRLSRSKPRLRDFSDQDGDGAIFQTEAETAQFFRPRRRRHDFSDQDGDGATFQTKAERARLSSHRRDSATKNQFLATKAETTRLSRPSRRRRDKNQFLATKAETTRLSRLKRRRRDFSDQDRDGAFFQTKAERARPRINSLRPRRRRRDF